MMDNPDVLAHSTGNSGDALAEASETGAIAEVANNFGHAESQANGDGGTVDATINNEMSAAHSQAVMGSTNAVSSVTEVETTASATTEHSITTTFDNGESYDANGNLVSSDPNQAAGQAGTQAYDANGNPVDGSG